eukprot:COSAG06_NODE_2653_length_6493_cov_24.617870_4_plen_158_part_00
MRKARQHEAKEHARVQDQKEGKDGTVMLKDKKLALYVYLLKKSCNIMNTAVNSSAAKPPGPGGGHRGQRRRAAPTAFGAECEQPGRRKVLGASGPHAAVQNIRAQVRRRTHFYSRNVSGIAAHPLHSPSTRFSAAGNEILDGLTAQSTRSLRVPRGC